MNADQESSNHKGHEGTQRRSGDRETRLVFLIRVNPRLSAVSFGFPITAIPAIISVLSA
jgi:hypothetical protein